MSGTRVASGRIPSLDGVRAIAFGLVFVSHAGLEHLVPGGFGVMVFFVLSGYLITTLLRTEFQHTGDLSFRNFYLRRALRILPPLYLTLLFLLGLHLALGYADPLNPRGILMPAFFLGNYFLQLDYPIGTPVGFGLVWSLAIEEHYYLFFPPLALWLLRRRSRRLAVTVLGLLCLAVLLLRLLLYFHFGVSETYLYNATETRCDGLLLGSLMGLVRNPWLDPPRQLRRRHDALWLALAIATLLFSFVFREPWFRATLRYSLQGLALLPVFWLAVVRWQWWPLRWLNHPLLVQLGDLSYTLYLVHFGIICAIRQLWPAVPVPALQLGALAVSLAYALAMRRFVERPLRRLGRHPGGTAVAAPAAAA